MRVLRILAALCASFGVLAACTPDAPVASDPPASAAVPVATVDADAALSAFLSRAFDADASAKDGWPHIDDDGVAWTRSVCARGPAGTRLLVAICTSLDEPVHVYPGGLDFFLLEAGDDGLREVASSRNHQAGSSGQPGLVTIARLGRDTYGFIVEHGWAGQGYVFGANSIMAFRGTELVTVADVRSELWHDPGSTCETAAGCADDAFDLQFDLDFDNRDAQAASYPLQVHEHGTECGHVVDRRHRFIADPQTGLYPVPETLMREECLDPAAPAED